MFTIISLVLYLQLLAVFFSVATAEEEQRLVEYQQTEKTSGNEEGDENLDELPNIIIVLLDDVGFNDLGFVSDSEEMNEIRGAARSRHRDIVPPFYKKLLHKDQAIALTSYYTQSLCTPSRASLLTGYGISLLRMLYIYNM